MGRYGTMLVGPIVFAMAASGCYTQFGATREETYAEEPEYEVYDDSAAYAEEYTEEGYQEARERFYFHYYYPTFSVGFSIGDPWYGGWSYTYYDPYWWGPGWAYSPFWYPWCWYPAHYYYPVYYDYYAPIYAWRSPSHPVYGPGGADVDTRVRGFGNTRTSGGGRGFGGTFRDRRRDPNIVLAGGADSYRRTDDAALAGPSEGNAGRSGYRRAPATRSTKAGLDREMKTPDGRKTALRRKDKSKDPIRVKIRKSSRTPSGSSRVKAKSDNSGSRRTYRPSGRNIKSKDPVRVKLRGRGTPSGSSRVKGKSGSAGNRRTYKPSSSRSSKPRASYGGSRGSVRSSPSGASRSGSAPRSAPRSSGGSRGRSRR
jgi:hypothetical protein